MDGSLNQHTLDCSQEYIRKDKQKESSEANSVWEEAKIGSVQAACLIPIRLLYYACLTTDGAKIYNLPCFVVPSLTKKMIVHYERRL